MQIERPAVEIVFVAAFLISSSVLGQSAALLNTTCDGYSCQDVMLNALDVLNVSLCINDSQRCDLHADCPYSDDEWNCPGS